MSLAGCSYFVSWDDKSQASIGQPIEAYIDLNGPPDEIRELPNGKREYEYRLRNVDPTCIHYWIVDIQGVIAAYRYEGRCRPIG
jgi:hypothetical protein